ncbi:MAG: chemotaxis protein CheA [Desulfosarcina sp.]|nr:chemotaxis protein CheA [Desulfobacterales bacterium]
MIDLSLLQDFIAESEEHLEEMEAGLLKLESEPDNQESLNDVFRTAHSIKGSAEYIGAEKTALLSHKLENLLEAVRQGKQILNDKIINTLMDARDRLLALIAELDNDKEEKTDTADIMERIENLSADNDEAEDDIVELANVAVEPPGGDGFIELTDVVDETCREGDDAIIELTDIADDSSCKYISASTHPLFSDDEMGTSEDVNANSHPLFGGETDTNPETGESVTYEDDNDEELFDIFFEHLKENIFSIKGLTVNLPVSDNCSDLLVKCTNAILSLKSSANYMDFMELVDVYEEWLSWVEKFQEEMFLADGIEFECFFKSVKNYLDRIAAFFPSHKELCIDFDMPDHASTEAEVKAPDDPVDALSGLECEEEAGRKEDKEETSLLDQEQEPVGEQDYAEAVNDPETPDDEFLVGIEDREDMSAEVKVEPEFFNKKSETELSDYKESASSATDGETDLAPLSEACVVSDTIDEGLDAVAVTEEKYPAAGRDDFVKDLQPEFIKPPPPVAAEKEFPEAKIIKQSVRVDAGKIDALMNQAGELVVSRAGFSQILNEMKDLQQELNDNVGIEQKEFKQFKDLAFRLSEATATLGRVANELQEGVMKVRMLPISQLFNRYPRLVRDLVHDINKKVRLDIAGEETELDKMVIQEIADPMVHIIRNAVDHGIETIPERLKAGKPEEGVLKLTSYHESNHVVVEIIDDGRGINPDLIKEVALKKGLFTAQELERMAVKDLIGILMIPGFSTAAKVSKTSGRGVGMDVVKQNIEKLNGTIEIDSKPGSGSRLRIKIPLTLAIIKALMVRIGKDIFTIPLAAVEETLQILSSDISVIEGVEVIHLRDSVLSLLRLSGLFKIGAAPQSADKEFVVVINTGMRQVGLIVDALLGQEEVVIKPLADYLQDNSGFSGATILGDGSISLILDIYELINMSMDMQSARKERLKYSGAPANRFEQFSTENYEGYPIH